VRWVTESRKTVEDLALTSTTVRGVDSQGNKVLFFENEWSIRLAEEKNPGLVLSEIEPMRAFEA
jgi:peptide chain release factor 3